MEISPLLLSRAADLLVVAVTSALIVSVPSTVPIQVFVDHLAIYRDITIDGTNCYV